MRFAAIMAAALLSGCAVVDLHTANPDDVRLSVWPLGVRIEAQPGAADGVTVNLKTFGLAAGCGAAGLGFSAIQCTQIDPRACGAIIVTADDRTDEDVIEKVADETRARCARSTQEKIP